MSVRTDFELCHEAHTGEGQADCERTISGQKKAFGTVLHLDKTLRRCTLTGPAPPARGARDGL